MKFGHLAYIDKYGVIRYVVNNRIVLDNDYTIVEGRLTYKGIKMMTKTQMAKTLWSDLYKMGVIDLCFEGLMGDAVWVSSHNKAYRLHHLSETHLNNIIAKYLRHGEEVPNCLKVESLRRKELASTL